MKNVLAFAALPFVFALLGVGCWGDTCDEPCRPGYSCYYGICLSRGFCPGSDPNTEPEHPCIERDPETDECTERSPYAVCKQGYSCECKTSGSDTECLERYCKKLSSVDD